MAASDAELKREAALLALVKSMQDLVRELRRERRKQRELHDHEHLGEDDL